MWGKLFWHQIGIASSPNAESDDVWLAFKLLLTPWKWFAQEPIIKLEQSFQSLLNKSDSITFESGRVALYEILKGWDLQAGDEVIIQAFTCVVVPDVVVWTGAKPIYVDIGPDYNLNPNLLESKITPHTKVIVVQHTFGYPAQVEKILEIAKKYHLKVVEDCAHLLGSHYRGQLLGSFGDVSFFSFGQEKAISSVRGGIVVTSDQELARRLKEAQSSLRTPSLREVFTYLFHPVLWAIVLPLYYFGVGKGVLFLAYRLGLTQSLVDPDEIAGRRPAGFPARMAGAQALQVLNQVRKIERFNRTRVEVANLYQEGLEDQKIGRPLLSNDPLLRFCIRVSSPDQLRNFAKKWHIILGNWYNAPVYPIDSNLKAVNYEVGSCPEAESAAHEVINLPTYPKMTKSDAKRVVDMIESYYAEAN